jgi:hypothetical protein
MCRGRDLVEVSQQGDRATAKVKASSVQKEDWVTLSGGSTMVDYAAETRQEAQQMAQALAELDALLANPDHTGLAPEAIQDLRLRVRQALGRMRTDLAALDRVDQDDPFKTNPVFATQRYQLMERLEDTRITFEFDLLPGLRELTRQTIGQASAAQAGEPGPGFVQAADKLLEQSNRAVTLVSKVLPIVQALTLLFTGQPVTPV